MRTHGMIANDNDDNIWKWRLSLLPVGTTEAEEEDHDHRTGAYSPEGEAAVRSGRERRRPPAAQASRGFGSSGRWS